MNKVRRRTRVKQKTSIKRKPPTRRKSAPRKDISATTEKSNTGTKASRDLIEKKVHITLQGKGGVGKSFVSSLLAQYYIENKQPVICFDTDAVNATLSGYQALDARPVELMDGSHLKERKFDEMMESILSEDCHFVVDNGSSTFIPLSNYLIENQAVEMISETGKQVMIHSVITGGQGLPDTLNGFSQLAGQLPEMARIIVWLNEYFGDIVAAGMVFEEMDVYTQHQHKVAGIVRIPRHTASTFGKDVELILDQRLTFQEAMNSEDFGPMSKRRLAMVKDAIFTQLAIVI